mmetsp:Transcript_22927/g.74696  ORF Transcript_22927/g.74696 Transcript_22927/m.74696 type:complete len:332 (-) Transcript_22927:495-1490(-)
MSAMTLGMMCVRVHSTPNSSPSLRRLLEAASRMEYTWSESQPRQRAPSFSSKKFMPSCEARSGMYSMMARRTRQCRSSARSTMAGRSDWERRSTPITWFTWSSFEMMLRRTSGNSSLRRTRKMGRSWSMVAALPRTGARPMMTEASAERTCCDVSEESSRTTGRICPSAWSAPIPSLTSPQNCATLPALAMRTSASVSLSRRTYAGNSSARTSSIPTASHMSYSCCATMYRTRHDLSCENFCTIGSTFATQSSFGSSFPNVAHSSTANSRTLSWSSCVSSEKSCSASVLTNSVSSAAAYLPSACAAARRTIGVSSCPSCWKSCRSSARLDA